MSGGQSKLASAVEVVVNTLLGLGIAFVVQGAIAWANDIHLSPHDNLVLVFWMTIVSVVRSYVVRRLWNSEFWKRWHNGH